MLKVDRTSYVAVHFCLVFCAKLLHGRPYNTHDLIDSHYLPERHRKPQARTDGPDELVENDCDCDYECCDPDPPAVRSDPTLPDSHPIALRVSIIPSPVLNTFYYEHPM